MQHGPLARGWRTAVIIASGPSMDAEQAALIIAAHDAGRCNTITINSSWQLHPGADVLFACDAPWWQVYLEQVAAAGVTSEFWCQDRRRDDGTRDPKDRRHTALPPFTIPGGHSICFVRAIKADGKLVPWLTTTPNVLHSGGNSGFQAINLAYLFGARRIVLVGFDMQKAANGAAHWHPEHPRPLAQAKPFDSWIPRFDGLARDCMRAGVTVINATRSTALQCFPRMHLSVALA